MAVWPQMRSQTVSKVTAWEKEKARYYQSKRLIDAYRRQALEKLWVPGAQGRGGQGMLSAAGRAELVMERQCGIAKGRISPCNKRRPSVMLVRARVSRTISCPR